MLTWENPCCLHYGPPSALSDSNVLLSLHSLLTFLVNRSECSVYSIRILIDFPCLVEKSNLPQCPTSSFTLYLFFFFVFTFNNFFGMYFTYQDNPTPLIYAPHYKHGCATISSHNTVSEYFSTQDPVVPQTSHAIPSSPQATIYLLPFLQICQFHMLCLNNHKIYGSVTGYISFSF